VQSPLRYLIPNGFTAASMALGLASITCSATGDFSVAAWMVLWGVLLDKLDGGAARMLNASSAFGAEMDSFADFVSFGIAPSALFYFFLVDKGLYAEQPAILMGCCGLYTIALSARLARFNVSEPAGSKRFFFGIPSTLCGAMLGSGFLAAIKFNAPDEVWTAFPLLMATFAVLMVSNIRLPKFQLIWSKPVNVFMVVNMLSAYILAPLMIYPEFLLFQSSGYMLVGVAWALTQPRISGEQEPQLEEPLASS
jgi:CDP-diacylglycerol--serine O-phosphatidyltransferase